VETNGAIQEPKISYTIIRLASLLHGYEVFHGILESLSKEKFNLIVI
jgi:hypothetical protein